MATADNNHCIALFGKRICFLLPIGSCITYCSKYFTVCTYLFKNFLAFFPFFKAECCLRHANNIIFLRDIMTFNYFKQFGFVSKHIAFARAKGAYSQNLGMTGITCDKSYAARLPLADYFMNFQNERACGINIRNISAFYIFDNTFFNSMRADNDFISFFTFTRRRNNPDAL